MPIELGRFELRELAQRDAKDYYDVFNSNRARIAEFDMVANVVTKSVSDVESALSRPKHMRMGLWVDSCLVGSVAVVRPRTETEATRNALMISYWLDQDYLGKGYAAESVRAMTEFIIEGGLSSRIVAKIHPDNAASIKVAKAAGYQLLEARSDSVLYEATQSTLPPVPIR